MSEVSFNHVLIHEHAHAFVEHGRPKWELVRVYQIPERPETRVVDCMVWTFSCRGAVVHTQRISDARARAA